MGIGQKYEGEWWRSKEDGRSMYRARCRLSVHEKEMNNVKMQEDSRQLP